MLTVSVQNIYGSVSLSEYTKYDILSSLCLVRLSVITQARCVTRASLKVLCQQQPIGDCRVGTTGAGGTHGTRTAAQAWLEQGPLDIDRTGTTGANVGGLTHQFLTFPVV